MRQFGACWLFWNFGDAWNEIDSSKRAWMSRPPMCPGRVWSQCNNELSDSYSY
jgi:hypothetical protein